MNRDRHRRHPENRRIRVEDRREERSCRRGSLAISLRDDQVGSRRGGWCTQCTERLDAARASSVTAGARIHRALALLAFARKLPIACGTCQRSEAQYRRDHRPGEHIDAAPGPGMSREKHGTNSTSMHIACHREIQACTLQSQGKRHVHMSRYDTDRFLCCVKRNGRPVLP